MTQTLKAGEHKLVMTRLVNDRVAGDAEFAKFVWASLVRFNRGDWGSVSTDDWKANDADLESLNSGGWYGRILGSYCLLRPRTNTITAVIWIIRGRRFGGLPDARNTAAITVLFDYEY